MTLRSISGRSATAGLVLGLMACGAPPAGYGGAAAPARASAPIARDDRVVIGNGTLVTSVAVGRRWVVARTPTAVDVYDRDLRAWQPPLGREAGFEPSAVRAIAHDPDDDSFWLLSTTSHWQLQPATGLLTPAPAGPLPARLQRGTLDALYREWPALQSFAGLLTRDDAALRGFDVISGARAPDRAEAWIGTNGGGLFQVDPLFNRAESRPFGLVSGGAGPLARAADGVITAGSPLLGGSLPAVTVVARDLQRWRWVRSTRGTLGAGQGLALLRRNGEAWLGTVGGLFRLPLDKRIGIDARQVPDLPSPVVRALATTSHGVWVGTSRGLVVVDDSASSTRAPVLEGGVHALLARNDTLWIGTDAGVVLRMPSGELRRPLNAPGTLSAAVRALALDGASLFVATGSAVFHLDLRSGVWSEPMPPSAVATVGELRAVDADARSLWVAGALGVASLSRRDGVVRIARVGAELPAEPTHLLLDGAWGWVSTPEGLVRFRRASDGALP